MYFLPLDCSVVFFFLLLFRFLFFVFVFLCLLFALFSRMRMSSRSYPVGWHGIALPTVLTPYLVRGNVVYLHRCGVAV